MGILAEADLVRAWEAGQLPVRVGGSLLDAWTVDRVMTRVVTACPPEATVASAWETMASLDWQQAGLTVEFRPPVDEDLVGITGCFCAIAETGTLMLLSGAQTYASAALLPETHIAVIPLSRVVRSMEDAFALAKQERGELPRATNFISGPSRTGDIEQTIVLGAHGPYRVHVILVRGA